MEPLLNPYYDAVFTYSTIAVVALLAMIPVLFGIYAYDTTHVGSLAGLFGHAASQVTVYPNVST